MFSSHVSRVPQKLQGQGLRPGSLHFAAAGGAALMKKGVILLLPGGFLKLSPHYLPVVLRTREHLKDEVVADASSFYTSDFKAKPSCYILTQKKKKKS